MIRCVTICCIITAGLSHAEISTKTFPEDFMFGVATSSYQIEGAWNEEGKGESIWDRYLHDNPNITADSSNGDIACDSYHKWKEDVQLLKDLGVNHYRFSLSWPRILPKGFANETNEAGIKYYKNLIKELKANNIEPLVTLYHWDLPQALQDLGGIVNDDFVDWFAEYARTCFELFGDEVKYWMTFNEPISICILHLAEGMTMAPGEPAGATNGTWEYQCGHNLLKAHAEAWHIYDNEFRAKHNGTVGIVIVTHWFQPATNTTEDELAAETFLQFMFGWWAHPIFVGDYPTVMKENIGNRSEIQGYNTSRLPAFTDEEIAYIKGTADILGVNVYTAQLAKAVKDITYDTISWWTDTQSESYSSTEWLATSSDLFKVTPWSLGELTKWIQKSYGNPKMIITENGYAGNGTLEDDNRIYYLQTYLSSLREAMDVEKVNVIGYTTWSLMDNLEWISGYTIRFGLYHVDFESENRTRTPKKSAEYFKNLTSTRCIAESCSHGQIGNTSSVVLIWVFVACSYLINQSLH